MAEDNTAPQGAPAGAEKPAKKAPAEGATKAPKKEGAKPAAKKEAEAAAPAAPKTEAPPATESAAAPAAGEKPQPKTNAQVIAEILGEDQGAIKVRKAKGSKNVTTGQAHVTATFNNTFVTITDLKGQVIAWSCAGKCGFRGSRKSTAYAAQVVAQDAARNGMAHGLKEITIFVRGPGLGRDSAIRALQAVGLEILSVIDVTPIPHNGCRARKRRRV